MKEISVSYYGTIHDITEMVSPFHNIERHNSSYFFLIVREVASQLKMSVIEQSTKIRFWVLLQRSPEETLTLLQHWHDSIDDDPRIVRPSTPKNEANFERVREIMRSDSIKSVDQIASEVGISVGSCHCILHDVLNMRHVCHHLIPRVLTYERKKNTNVHFRWPYRCGWWPKG
jgi:hypothetical protein